MRRPLENDNPLGSVDPLVIGLIQVNPLFNGYPSFDTSMKMALNPML